MLFKIKSYIKFLISGTSKYSIHSPFLHHFIQDVLDHGGIFYCFPAIELVRKKVSQDKKTIKKSDFWWLGRAGKISYSNIYGSGLPGFLPPGPKASEKK